MTETLNPQNLNIRISGVFYSLNHTLDCLPQYQLALKSRKVDDKKPAAFEASGVKFKITRWTDPIDTLAIVMDELDIRVRVSVIKVGDKHHLTWECRDKKLKNTEYLFDTHKTCERAEQFNDYIMKKYTEKKT